ncbi:ABC transporter ATP-binding protein [Pseudoclostridium thermosuccinogenes]|jgi:cell division transport system ATP-binding protein|uniref:cell division ATP-binding protein FtsE n=1 Tax=Clostridium thermosuccinogenes TaxID=84032 RepID=UPI000CCC84B3|nr:ABC transporter ATP-binding protein [Pseudoclostridium thermosuccinogenes]PNT92376.1 ABC transporter [Pseudoclostridium thermosuccinogenes]
MIEAKGVSLRYKDGTLALHNVNLEIKPGELVYITGPSGSGKTSLLKLFMGVEYPTSGALKVLGQAMFRRESMKIRKLRRKIGPVFQDFRLIEGRTAMENVMMGMRFLGIPSRQIKQNAINALARVGLEHKAYSRVENLSWGEAQRVSIARAVARKPALILADEPTGNLDHANALNILDLLTSFKDKNTTVIITTHATHLIEDQKNATFVRVNKGNISIERRCESNEELLI